MDNLHPVVVRKSTLLAIHRMTGIGLASKEEVMLEIGRTNYELLSISTLPRPAGAEAVPLLYVRKVEK